MTLYGVLGFILVFAILVFFHELGHFLFAKLFKMRVEEFAIGVGPRLIRLWNDGQTDYTIRAIPLGGFVRVAGMEIEDAAERRLTGTGDSTNHREEADAPDAPKAYDPNGFNSRPIYQRFWVILAGPLFSFLLGWLSLCLVGVLFGTPDKTTLAIGKVTPGGVAESIGLKPKDTFVSLNGEPVTDAEKALLTIRESPDKPLTLVIRTAADKQEKTLTVTPKAETVPGEAKPIGRLGFEPRFIVLSVKPTDLATSFERGNRMVTIWFTTIVGLFQSGKIKDNVGGPVAIFKETQNAAAEGPSGLMLMLGQLSLSLGLFNLFPIPILDGGHLLLMGLEAIRRRKLTAEQTQRVFTAGFAVLALLFVVVMYKDISGLFTRG